MEELLFFKAESWFWILVLGDVFAAILVALPPTPGVLRIGPMGLTFARIRPRDDLVYPRPGDKSPFGNVCRSGCSLAEPYPVSVACQDFFQRRLLAGGLPACQHVERN